jgi:hypothetical protein
VFALSKYVDINTFFRLLLGGQTRAGTALALVLSVAGFVWLSASWWRWRRRRGPTDLLWSATLAWTLVCGVYTPIYDTILIVPAIILIAGTVREKGHFESFAALTAMIYSATFVTQPLAATTGFQVLTPLLAAIGVFALRLYESPPAPVGNLDDHTSHRRLDSEDRLKSR